MTRSLPRESTLRVVNYIATATRAIRRQGGRQRSAETEELERDEDDFEEREEREELEPESEAEVETGV